MSESIYAGYLCASHIGGKVLAIDDEFFSPALRFLAVTHSRKRSEVKLILGADRSSDEKSTTVRYVDPRAVITVTET